MSLLYLPVALFLATVLWIWLAAPDDVESAPKLRAIGGSAGLASAIVTAYAIRDQSQKFADDASHVDNVAAVLLVAHAALFLALLLRKA